MVKVPKLKSKKISPLRYPGGKTRASVKLFKYIPEDTVSLCSPFFGGGSFEIFCARNGIKVHGYDNFKPLVEFWQCLLNCRNKLADTTQNYYPLKKQKFKELQSKKIVSKSKIERAAIFFVLNRASYSGSILRGGMAVDHQKKGVEKENPRFNKKSIEFLRNFRIKNLTVRHADFKKSISMHRNTLLYLDPPYFLENNLYGHKSSEEDLFDHEGLLDVLHKRTKWILSYNKSPKVKKLYRDFDIYEEKWSYGMSDVNSRKKNTNNELVILSPDINKIYTKQKKSLRQFSMIS